MDYVDYVQALSDAAWPIAMGVRGVIMAILGNFCGSSRLASLGLRTSVRGDCPAKNGGMKLNQTQGRAPLFFVLLQIYKCLLLVVK